MFANNDQKLNSSCWIITKYSFILSIKYWYVNLITEKFKKFACNELWLAYLSAQTECLITPPSLIILGPGKNQAKML